MRDFFVKVNMNYKKLKDSILIYDKENFNPQHILECGQVFSYKKIDDKYIVYPKDKYAEITEEKEFYKIKTNDTDFFENYFDLKNDYSLIKTKLSKFNILKQPIKYGYGIRILSQDLFETLISFIISANNNIKRIHMILDKIRENLGDLMQNNTYSFPTYEKLAKMDKEFFVKIGAGYRAEYIVKVLKQINPKMLEEAKELETYKLRNFLISLSGIGPKVADCILLFGYKRGDVFPVDTWIHQMYNNYYPKLENREKIRNNLVNEFKSLSGYAQQYLFFYQRSGENK